MSSVYSVVPVHFALVVAIVACAVAQQTDSTKSQESRQSQNQPDSQASQPRAKKAKSEQAAAKAEVKNLEPMKPTEPAVGDERKPDPSAAATDKDKEKEEHYDVAEVAPIVTHHQVSAEGKVLRYTATAGRLPLKRGDGKIEAEMFFVAYTLDGTETSKRPLTFAFNGGPGSASIWLHMGALGPKHVAMRADGSMPPPPFRIEDNASTLLDRSDLVFVDAMGTGFSRAATPDLLKKFLGVKGDIDAFSEFIRLYLTRYERWSSPLYLFGESYGTTRAAGIAGRLADQGVSFNGITLLSMALTFQTLEDTKSNDQPYVLLIPSYTMIAGFHKRLAPDLAADLGKARRESEAWAAGDYAQALAKGDTISTEERQRTIEQMARYTGLTKEYIDQANLRVNVEKFTHVLLLDQKLRVGRLDGRFTGTDPDGLLDTPFYDPTQSQILPPFTSVFSQYVRTELGFKSDMPYFVFAPFTDSDTGWDWGSAGGGFPDTATALRQAIVKNPYMKVLVMEGYYDLATPYFAANYTVDHLNIGADFRKNISYATYEAGHMVYLPAEGAKKLKSDESAFMDKAGGMQ